MTNDEVKAALEEIARQHNDVLRPEDVVESARDPQHPLHARFEWDDAKAAAQHRLDQARELIRSVRVVITTERKTLTSVYYVAAPSTSTETGYRSLPRVRSDVQLARETIHGEWQRVEGLLRRTHEIALGVGLGAHAALALELLQRIERGVEEEHPSAESRVLTG